MEWRNENRIDISSPKGERSLFMAGGGAPKTNVSLGKNFAAPTVEIFLPNLKYQLKNY